jgi:hypothetical protein
MIVTVAETVNVSTVEATGILSRLIRDTADNIHGYKLNCAEDRRIRWTTYQNLELWHDSWDDFLVQYGFATIDATGTVTVKEELKGRIINMDETCLSLDGSNGNRGGRPTVTYHDIRFPHLGQATRGVFSSLIRKLIVNYIDVFADNPLHKKTSIYTMDVVISTICPPDGFRPNQAHPTSPMVCGWHLRTRLGHCHATG